MTGSGYFLATLILCSFLTESMGVNEIPEPYQPGPSSEIYASSEHSKRYPGHFDDKPATYYWLRLPPCPKNDDGVEQFHCTSAASNGHCIDDHHLCNDVKDCAGGEDEDPVQCFFYRFVKADLDELEYIVRKVMHNYNRPAQRLSLPAIARPPFL